MGARAEAIPRIDPKQLFQQSIEAGLDVNAALAATAQLCASHALSVFESTGDLSLAVQSIDVDVSDQLKTAVFKRIGNRTITTNLIQDAVLYVVGGGGIAGIPKAKCLHKYLPKGRKPTRKEMEEAWAKCSQATV